jgi:hypothetical protein
VIIDDNPNICGDILLERNAHSLKNEEMIVATPYYPSVANQHHKEALLIKTSVSDLTLEDFSPNNS